MEKQKWEHITVSKETNNQLKLLAVISGLSVAEIVRRFAKVITPLAMKNKNAVFGCKLEFNLTENLMYVKLKPRGF